MTKKNTKEEELEEFRKSIENINEKEFDGHSNFESLSVREKLTWLSELNCFKYIIKK